MPRPAAPRVLAIAGALAAIVAWLAPAVATSPAFAAAAWAWLVVAIVGTGWRFAARWVADAAPSEFLLATALVSLAFASSVVVLTGLVGAFHLPVVLLVVAGVQFFGGRAPTPRSWRQLVDELQAGRAFDPVVAACVLLLGVAFAIVAMNQLRFTTQDADSMWYHLVMPAEWVRTGSVWPSDAVPLLARAYPGFRQAVVALLSLPMRTEHLALLGLVEFPLLALASYVLARSFGASRRLAVAAALAAATTPVVLGATTTQGNDVMVAILVMAGAVFTPRMFASGRIGDAALAGLALAGLAATKFSGPGYAALLVVLAAQQHGVFGVKSWRVHLALASGVLLVAAPWYLRNLRAFHNPLWPARIMVWRKLAGWGIAFDGPLDGSYFADRTLGWNVEPLLQNAHQFVEAHGWFAPLLGVAWLGVVVRALLSRQSVYRAAVAALLSPLLFAMFLHHPFNMPSFDAAYSHRYLIAWAGVGFATLAAALPAAPLPGLLLALAALGSAALALASISGLAWPGAAAALAGAAVLAAPRFRAVAARVLAAASRVPCSACALLLLAVLAFGGEAQRARWQYDPALGYRDGSSEKGWAACMKWVHRGIAGKRVGLHGSHFLFPLLGEPWSNEVLLADQPLVPGTPKSVAEVAAWAIDSRLDYLVCCREHARAGSRDFTFAPSIASALVAAHPQRFAIAYESDGACVLAVQR